MDKDARRHALVWAGERLKVRITTGFAEGLRSVVESAAIYWGISVTGEDKDEGWGVDLSI